MRLTTGEPASVNGTRITSRGTVLRIFRPEKETVWHVCVVLRSAQGVDYGPMWFYVTGHSADEGSAGVDGLRALIDSYSHNSSAATRMQLSTVMEDVSTRKAKFAFIAYPLITVKSGQELNQSAAHDHVVRSDYAVTVSTIVNMEPGSYLIESAYCPEHAALTAYAQHNDISNANALLQYKDDIMAEILVVPYSDIKHIKAMKG